METYNTRIRFAAYLVLGIVLMTSALRGADKPINLKLGTLAPAGTSYHKSLQTIGEQWRSATGGAVRLTIFPGGTQGGEADMDVPAGARDRKSTRLNSSH